MRAGFSGSAAFTPGSAGLGPDAVMMYRSYTIGRVGLFWRWQVELDGKPCKRGLSLAKASARWAARGAIRAARQAPPAEALRPPVEHERLAA